ncbi:nucleoside diphosphate kinase Ndk1 [Cryomyces antarcticus]|nr:nucleoside diphosphate kinase Ndk1 [Cryomyces antarcticus]
MTSEQTFIAVKPDGVQVRAFAFAFAFDSPQRSSIATDKPGLTAPQRGLIGPIITRFENRGFKLVAIKLVTPSKEHLEKHYADLSDKPFFKGLITCTFFLRSSGHSTPDTLNDTDTLKETMWEDG